MNPPPPPPPASSHASSGNTIITMHDVYDMIIDLKSRVDRMTGAVAALVFITPLAIGVVIAVFK